VAAAACRDDRGAVGDPRELADDHRSLPHGDNLAGLRG
jgi:hypothetical protein